MARAVSLNVYRILDHDHAELSELQAILTDEDYDEVQPTAENEFESLLLLRQGDRKRPEWVTFVETGFGHITAVGENAAFGALLLIRTAAGRLFAIPFGQGRHLLKPGSWEQNYGLRVVVNLLAKPSNGGSLAAGAIRSVDAKTVATSILHTRRQTDRRATFEAFGVDTTADLVRAITGHPPETEEWGARVTGGDSVKLLRRVAFAELGTLCESIEEMAREQFYATDYSWIDNVKAVIVPELKAQLTERALEILRAGQTDDLDLAPPDVVAWEEEIAFRFTTHSNKVYDEVKLSDYLDSIDPSSLTVERLKEDRLLLVNAEEMVQEQWSILNSLTGEVELDGTTYVLSGGAFYAVRTGYLTELNASVESIQETQVSLIDWVNHREEKHYNKAAADASGGELLLMDRNNIKVSTSTSEVELCDLLTRNKKLVHVKPKGGSSTLSHLFAQGFVSADLMLMSQEFRQKALDIVGKAEAAGGYAPNTFAYFGVTGIVPSEYEIVYMIAGKWRDGASLKDLPFFSKINLRRTAQELRRMGYRLSYKLVDRRG